MESISRRRDVRALRARLLVLLLELRCPVKGRPRKGWYVPGAVARLSVEAMRRAWRGFYGEEPPAPRTLRAHLGLLQRVLALVRSPGDWVEVVPPSARWRPRYADTIHVLDDEEAVERWLEIGQPVLERRADIRTNPDAWRRHLGTWRTRSRAKQLELFQGRSAPAGRPEGLEDRVRAEEPVARGTALARGLGEALLVRDHDALDVLRALAAQQVSLRGRPSFELASNLPRLEGAAALLARALARGDAVRNGAAWLVRAHRHAKPAELAQARAWVLSVGRSPP